MHQKNSAPLINQRSNLAPNTTIQVQTRARAFTLIELLVVIVIIGILATIGVAAFNDYQEKARIAKAITFSSQAERIFMALAIEANQTGFMSYNFDEGSGSIATDHSGNGNDLDLVIDASTTWSNQSPFNTGSSLRLASKRINKATPASFNANGMSIMTFLKVENYGISGSIPIFIGNNGIRILPDGTLQFYLMHVGTGSYETLQSDTTMKLDKWQHLLATYDREFMRLYIDGELVGEKAYSAEVINYNTFSIGYDSANSEITALYDQVRIFPVGGRF